MSIARAQAGVSTEVTGASGTLAYGSNVAQRELLIVGALTATQASPFSGVPTDTLGNTYSAILASVYSPAGRTQSLQLWLAVSKAAGANTVTFKNTAVQTVLFAEAFKGAGSNPGVDLSATNSGAALTALAVPSAGSTAALLQGNELVVAIALVNNTNVTSWTATPAGYTADLAVTSGAPVYSIHTDWEETNGTTGVSASWTWTTSSIMFGVVAAIAIDPHPAVFGQLAQDMNFPHYRM